MSTSTGGNQPQPSTETVTQQAKEVAANAQRQARNLLQGSREQVKEQARAGQQKAAQRLESVASELRSMAEKSDQSGPTTNLTLQAADTVHEIASWLQAGEPGDVLVAARDWARRHPGALTVGAVIAGGIVGRLTRSGGALVAFGAGWLASSLVSAGRARQVLDSAKETGRAATSTPTEHPPA